MIQELPQSDVRIHVRVGGKPSVERVVQSQTSFFLQTQKGKGGEGLCDAPGSENGFFGDGNATVGDPRNLLLSRGPGRSTRLAMVILPALLVQGILYPQISRRKRVSLPRQAPIPPEGDDAWLAVECCLGVYPGPLSPKPLPQAPLAGTANPQQEPLTLSVTGASESDGEVHPLGR